MDTTRFLQEADQINDTIESMKESVSAVERLQRDLQHSVGHQEEQDAKRQLDSVSRETNDIANVLRDRLKELERNAKSNQPGSRDEVMRRTQCTNLVNKFMKVLSRYQKAQVSHKKATRTRMERQYRIVNPDASDAEMKEDLSNDDSSIFTQKLAVAGKKEAKAALEEVRQRHEQILQLAESIEELQQLFLDMQSMVATQDEIVININNQVDNTRSTTERSAAEVKEAVKQKRLSKRKCMYLTIAILILIIIIVISVYFAHFHPLVMQAAEQEISKQAV